jgi:hypothetical protein
MLLFTYLVLIAILLENWFLILVIGALMAIPLLGTEWLSKKMPTIKRVGPALVIGAVVLVGAYNSSRTFASFALFDTGNPEEISAMANEYWYRLFVSPVFPKYCYSSNQRDCERWAPYLAILPGERILGGVISLIFGLLMGSITFGTKVVIKGFLIPSPPGRG